MGEGEVENGRNSRGELKRDLECVVTDSQDGSACKRQAKDASNEDVCSGMTDAIISPPENEKKTSSGEAIVGATKGVDLDSSGDNSGDITSTSVEMSSDEDNFGLSASHGILEIPKKVSSTGIRKITFKFSKSKEEWTKGLTAREALQPLSNGVCRAELPFLVREHGPGRHVLHNKELKMSKKVLPDVWPTNVKKLLSTAILEGARVKYVTPSRDKEIPGIIRGCGYLCGCSTCEYKNVLSAYEFEKHAGGSKTKHPNNHIHLENGRPIYSIIKELKNSSHNLLENVVKDIGGSAVNEFSFQAWKASVQQSDGSAQVENNYKSYTNLDTEKPYPNLSARDVPKQKTYSNKIGEGTKQKGRRPKSSSAKLSVPHKKCGGSARKRDHDLHRLLFMPNGLPDGADLVYYCKGQKTLNGIKRGNGILCDHCNREISPSQFEAHAGWAIKRQPYRNIYTSNGLALHDIAISLANGQSLPTGHSDDMCTICGNGGHLTLCRRCPRAYHAACLGSQYIAEEDWCCPDCFCKASSGDTFCSNMKPIKIRLTRVVKEVECDNGGCIICRSDDFSSDIFDDRTVIICDQCEKEYHVSCLRDRGLCDLKALPDGYWFCCGDCSRIHDALWDQFLKGAESVPTSVFNRTLLLKGLNNASEDDVRCQVINGSKRSSEHLPLLSRATAIFREQFNPIVSSSGRDLIPVMVYGRNISGQEFGGMYTVLLFVKSVVVSAGLLRIFGCELAELPLVATSKENQGKGYFQALFFCIGRLLSSLNVENLVLPASEEAKGIWTDKFGFRIMSQERVSNYKKSYQLTDFSGTSWLEKAVPHATM